MLARLARELPATGHLFEPKWDGFRCLAYRDLFAPVLEVTQSLPDV